MSVLLLGLQVWTNARRGLSGATKGSLQCDIADIHMAQLTISLRFGVNKKQKQTKTVHHLPAKHYHYRVKCISIQSKHQIQLQMYPALRVTGVEPKPAILGLKVGPQPTLVASSSPGINNRSHLQPLTALFSLTAKLLPRNNNLSGRAPGCDKARSLDLPSK